MGVRGRSLWLLVALMAGLADMGEAQRPGTAQRRPQAAEPGPALEIRVALRNRAELGLTDEQVKQLEALGERVQAKMRPYQEQMQEARRKVQAGEADRGWARERMRSLMEEARKATEPELKEFRELLMDEQETKLRELVREARRPERRPPGGSG